MNKITIVIIGMVLVTYIPRLIPFYIVSGKALPKKLKRFLEFVPYTALGALLIPGGFTAISGVPLASVLGLSFAFLMSWKKGGLIAPVIGAITVVAGVLLLG